ncbi:hypothetical protein V1280_006759 [Bradyrhizobium sp. AZCC 2230]
MTTRLQYGTPAKIFHWVIVALLAVQYPIGWLMPDLHHSMAPGAGMTFHISFGITILVLTALRLVWRLTHPIAPENSLPAWQRLSSEAVHWLLYVLVGPRSRGGCSRPTADGRFRTSTSCTCRCSAPTTKPPAAPSTASTKQWNGRCSSRSAFTSRPRSRMSSSIGTASCSECCPGSILDISIAIKRRLRRSAKLRIIPPVKRRSMSWRNRNGVTRARSSCRPR